MCSIKLFGFCVIDVFVFPFLIVYATFSVIRVWIFNINVSAIFTFTLPELTHL